MYYHLCFHISIEPTTTEFSSVAPFIYLYIEERLSRNSSSAEIFKQSKPDYETLKKMWLESKTVIHATNFTAK